MTKKIDENEKKSKNTTKKEKTNKETINAQKDIFLGYMPYIIIIFFVVIIRMFVATPVKVNGSSMTPTLKNGDTMLLYKLTKKTKGIKRFDIIVIQTDSGKLIKRVIGLPGETIKYSIETDENGKKVGVLYINGEKVEEKFITPETKVNTCHDTWELCTSELTIPNGEYFVMGDNRVNSKDSRMIGSIKDKDILGTTEIILFPFGRAGKVK